MSKPHVVAGYEKVAAAFENNFSASGEVGAGFCAYVGGERVVDLWGGTARPGIGWGPDTMAVVFSTTKGATAAAIQRLVASGALDVHRTVASYWPEFGSNDKSEITLEHILTHTSGVVTIPDYVDFVGDLDWWLDLDLIAAAMESTTPLWQPGTAHGYHATTFGFILNEVTRRATGRTIGAVLADEIAGPLGLDFHIGLDTGDERVAELLDAPPPSDPMVAMYLEMFTPDHLAGQAHLVGRSGLSQVAENFNDPSAWRIEFPSGGGIASARGVAGLYNSLISGGSTFDLETTLEHARERVRGPDLVLLYETAFGLGYQRPTSFVRFAPDAPSAFGHGGLGGSGGFADPDRGVAAGYVMNQIDFPTLEAPTRMGALVSALYGCLP